MVNYLPTRLDATFFALSDPTRRAMIAELARGETTAGVLAAPHAISLPAVSRHLRVLESAGLIERRRAGRTHRIRLAIAPIEEAAEWMATHRAFWERQLDALERFLADTPTEESRRWRNRNSRRSRSSSSATSRTRRRRFSTRGRRPRR